MNLIFLFCALAVGAWDRIVKLRYKPYQRMQVSHEEAVPLLLPIISRSPEPTAHFV